MTRNLTVFSKKGVWSILWPLVDEDWSAPIINHAATSCCRYFIDSLHYQICKPLKTDKKTNTAPNQLPSAYSDFWSSNLQIYNEIIMNPKT